MAHLADQQAPRVEESSSFAAAIANTNPFAITGGPGNDTLYGTDYEDTLRGEGGDDTLYGGYRSDLLRGGVGNDWTDGGQGLDVYFYEAGDGDDIIWDAQDDDGDSLAFGDGIDPDDVVLSRHPTDDSHVIITFVNRTGSILLRHQWWHESGIERMTFDGAPTWDEFEFASRYVSAQKTAGNDLIWGSNLDDHAEGGDGDDIIQTRWGKDTLIGGPGADRLEGAELDDTYVYNVGDGADEIYDAGTSLDRIHFGPGIAPTDIVFSRGTDSEQLRITFTNRAGSILVRNQWWFEAGVEAISFSPAVGANGSVTPVAGWDEAEIAARYIVAQSTPGDDTIWGSTLADIVLGGFGADFIQTRWGNDTLVGGPGNDVLHGGEGDDTYVYNPGDGDDVILDLNYSRNNALVFNGIALEDVLFSRPSTEPSSIRVTFKQMTGSVTITNQSWAEAGVELFTFANGSSLTDLQVETIVIDATEVADILHGGDGPDRIWALEGNDLAFGFGGGDELMGQDGNDTLEGGGGDDILRGGAGADTLRGETVSGFVPIGGNLLVNGSFEDSGTVTTSGSWGVSNSTMPGWSKTNSQDFEQIASGHGGIAARHGAHWLDLESVGGAGADMDIAQAVSGIAAGQTLQLQFAHANRGLAASGSFEVYWNGTLVATIADSSLSMRLVTLNLVAAAGDNVLRFRSTGGSEGIGSALDDVRLHLSEPGSGADFLDGGAGADQMTGGGGNDVYVVDDLGDSVIETIGGGSQDEVRTGLAEYTLPQQVERLTFIGTGPFTGFDNALDNALTGGAGADRLMATSGGIDSLSGGDGDDLLYYGSAFTAADSNFGGSGTDTVALGGSYARVLGAQSLVGVERLVLYSGGQVGGGVFSYNLTAVDANVAAGETLVVAGTTLRTGEALIFNGTAETDGRFILQGGSGNDTLVGGQKADTITGGSGADSLYGMNGNDQLVGSGGADLLRGGAGVDRFVFLQLSDSTVAASDRIEDFGAGSEKIDLSAIDAIAGTAANDSFTFIGGQAFGGVAGQLRSAQSGADTLIQADVDGDGIADFQIVLTGLPPILGTDILL